MKKQMKYQKSSQTELGQALISAAKETIKDIRENKVKKKKQKKTSVGSELDLIRDEVAQLRNDLFTDEPGKTSLLSYLAAVDSRLLALHNLLLTKEVYNQEEFGGMLQAVTQKMRGSAEEQREAQIAQLGFLKKPDTTIEVGDLVSCYVTGFHDGEEILPQEEQVFVVGDAKFEKIGNVILGKKEGSEVDFVLSYEDDEERYEDLAGKEVLFKATVNLHRKPIEKVKEKAPE